MKPFFYLITLLFLSGCGGSFLKERFCLETLERFPEAYWGTYEGALEQPNSLYNNAAALIKTKLRIDEHTIYTPEDDDHLFIQASPSLSQTNICLLDKSLFLEKLDGKGGYSLVRVEASHEGIYFSPMTFDPETLTKQQKVFTTPAPIKANIFDEPEKSSWYNQLSILAPIVVDNSSMTPKEVLTMAQFSVLRISFNRIPDGHRAFGKERKWSLSDYRKRHSRN